MLSTLLKHRIYESCIDIFFDGLTKNFNMAKPAPRIGDRYSFIYDTIVGDTFYDCILVPVEELSFYESLIDSYREEGLDGDNLAFGVRYTKYIDDLGEAEAFDENFSYGEATFSYEELDDIIFQE